jgi:hypothetical protein
MSDDTDKATIKTALDELTAMFSVTNDVLNDWKGAGNLQFPALLGMMAIKLNWDDKQMREADPLVRYFVRKHPDWYVTRGAHGGIMKTTEKQKKETVKTNKASIKDQLKAQIEAKVASTVVVINTDATTGTSTTTVEDSE